MTAESMDKPITSDMESRQSAMASQADATVLITTRPQAPAFTAKYQGSSSCQQNFVLSEELKLPPLTHPSHTADASQAEAEDNADADLQHVNTSDLQDYFQGWNSLTAQDVGGIAAANDGPALVQTSSDTALQQESGIVIDDVETLFYNADQAITGVSIPTDTAAFSNARASSTLFDAPDVMEASVGCSKREASLCCHLAAFLSIQLLQTRVVDIQGAQTTLYATDILTHNADGWIFVMCNAGNPKC